MKRTNGSDLDVSRLFIYYNARADEADGGRLTDSGCSMTSAIQALEKYGVCPEPDWPYDIERVHERPSDDAYQNAESFQIKEALQLDIDLIQMKSCLAQGFPFAFGLTLYNSFDKASKSGIVPMPDQSEQTRQSHGRFSERFVSLFTSGNWFFLMFFFSHAMLAVGYSDHSKSFIVRNSWGEYWVRF